MIVDVNWGTHTLVRYDTAANLSQRKHALSRLCKLCLGVCEQTKRTALTEHKRYEASIVLNAVAAWHSATYLIERLLSEACLNDKKEDEILPV